MKKEETRIRTNIAEFDKALSGGIPQGHLTLVTGAAGTMKSSLCFNILFHAVKDGFKGVYVTLEQTSQSMLSQIRSMGYKLESIKLQEISDTTALFAGLAKLNRENTDLVLVDVANIRREIARLAKTQAKHDWFTVVMSVLEKLKKQGLLELFVLDSLTALFSLSSFKEPRKDIFSIFGSIKDTGCTSFLVSEIFPESTSFSEYGVEDYMADGIIQLRMVRKEMKVLGELSVVKMRATPINRDVFIIEYKDNDFKVNPYWIHPQVFP